jgi:hypothetical protein
MAFDRGSRARLTARALERFPGETLFERLARAVCGAECLPRKELFETWEVARRVRRHFRGGRVIDLAAGHGLLGLSLMLLDDSSPTAIAVDRRRPKSAARLEAAVVEAWPRLAGRLTYLEAEIDARLAPHIEGQLFVSVHACGALTDRVLDLALGARGRVAVLPCCHDAAVSTTGALAGWLDPALAIDVERAGRLRAAGYRVRTLTIPSDITPAGRLLLGEPP